MQTAKTWTVPALMAENLVRIRRLRRLTVRQLSEKLGALEVPILPSGITNIEKQKRTVTVENLLAFAAVLNASPADFLSAPDEDRILLAPKMEAVKPFVVRTWLAGTTPLVVREGQDFDEARRELLEAAPEWFRSSEEREHRTFRHPAVSAITQLRSFVVGAILEEGGVERGSLAESMREQAKRVSAYVNLLADEVETRGRDA